MRCEMDCTNPKMRKLMGRYEFGILSPNEQKEFEAHLLQCQACFEELYSMTPVAQRMRENPDLFLRELAVREAAYVGILRKIKAWWRRAASGERNVLRPGIKPAAQPIFGRAVKVGVPVAFAIAVALILCHRFTPPPGKYAHLAVIERAYYRPVAIRTGERFPEAERLFDEAMVHYNRAEYAQAIEGLSKSIEKDPNNADAHFYLGICYLLERNAGRAIKHLQKALDLVGAPAEKYHWYLGNAHLLRENRNRALAEFKKVVDFEGDYQFEAKKIIAKMAAMEKEG